MIGTLLGKEPKPQELGLRGPAKIGKIAQVGPCGSTPFGSMVTSLPPTQAQSLLDILINVDE